MKCRVEMHIKSHRENKRRWRWVPLLASKMQLSQCCSMLQIFFFTCICCNVCRLRPSFRLSSITAHHCANPSRFHNSLTLLPVHMSEVLWTMPRRSWRPKMPLPISSPPWVNSRINLEARHLDIARWPRTATCRHSLSARYRNRNPCLLLK